VTVVYEMTCDEQSALAVDSYAVPWAVPATARPAKISISASVVNRLTYRSCY
jgi:hypothetical protein